MPTKNSVLLDSNILVYAVQKTSQFHQQSQVFLRRPGADYWVTSKNLVEFFVAVTKGDFPILDYDEALTAVEIYRKQYPILYPSLSTLLELETLLAKYPTKGFRVHDAEIAAIGLANGISTIATFNTDDFKYIGEITLLTP